MQNGDSSAWVTGIGGAEYQPSFEALTLFN